MCGKGLETLRGYQCDVVKVKPGLLWRLQDIRGAGVVGPLPRKAADWEKNHPKRVKYVMDNKVRAVELSKPFDIRHRFDICSARVWSYFGSVFPHNVPLSILER